MKYDYEDDTEEIYEISQDYDFEDEFLAGDLVSDLSALTKQYIDSYFQDKKCDVPKDILHAQPRLSFMFNTDINTGVKQAYKVMHNTISDVDRKNSRQFGTVTDDIKFVNEMLKEFAHAGIPKEFAGGMLIMHLEFCEGMSVGER